MKTLLLALIFSCSAFAQSPWDGTRGPITVKSSYRAPYTRIDIATTKKYAADEKNANGERVYHGFVVVAFILAPDGSGWSITDVAADMTKSGVATSNLQIPIGQIQSVMVLEIQWAEGSDQWFIPEPTRPRTLARDR